MAHACGALHLPLNTLALRRGGLIRAVILRANALCEADPQRPVVIEVLAFQPRLQEDVRELVDRGFLDARVHVRSVLRSIEPGTPARTTDCPITGCVHTAAVPRTRATAVTDPRTVALAAPDLPAGELARKTNRDAEGRLRWIDVVDGSGRRLRREEYGTGDRLLRVQDFRPGAKHAALHRWLDPDGRCYLAVW